MNLQKKEDESKEHYIWRVYNSRIENKLTNKQASEIINAELGTAFQESYFRGIYKNFGLGFQEAIDKYANDNNSEQYILELEEKKLEIQKEKIRMQDQRREWNKLVRIDARFEHLCAILKESVEQLNTIKPFFYTPSKANIIEDMEKTEAVLMLSDLHIGSEFKNAIAEYNIKIAKRRLNELLQKTITYCKMNNVETLHLELLGDNLNGGIHWSSKVESEEDTISQLMTYEEVISEFIYTLSKEIQYIKVYSVIGNHSRLNMNYKDNQKGENLERLVPHYLKARLQNIQNVEIKDDANVDDGIILFDVINTKIVGMHGDLDKPNKVVDNIIKMFKIIPNEINMGHYHQDFEKTEYDIELVINGSIQGTDSFAYRIRKSGQAMQKLSIYNEDGKLCTYKIKLK